MIAYLNQLAGILNRNYHMAIIMVFLQLVSALARYFNSAYLIQIEHSKRMGMVTVMFVITYALLGVTIML